MTAATKRAWGPQGRIGHVPVAHRAARCVPGSHRAGTVTSLGATGPEPLRPWEPPGQALGWPVPLGGPVAPGLAAEVVTRRRRGAALAEG